MILCDSHDYTVDAATIEEAAQLLAELQDKAQATSEHQTLPNNIESREEYGARLLVLDPEAIVDIEHGIQEIDEDGSPLRDIPAHAARQEILVTALTEIVRGSKPTGRWIDQINLT